MLSKILAISGKPGLYRYLSRGKNMLIVETVGEVKKRMPAYATDRIVALADISIYTNDDKEVPLASVFRNIQQIYDGKQVDLSPKNATAAEITDFFAKALPNYDVDRVKNGDMRKVLSWYNLLIAAGLDDFSDPKEGEDEKTESDGE